MSQIHSNNIFVVSESNYKNIIPDCDGLITSDADITLSVRTADCLPISLINKENHMIGLVHAGWRGLENKILANAISIIGNNLKVIIGPHICVNHYEVKEDVAQKFSKYVIKKFDKLYLDLGEMAKQQLIGLGVKSENIKIDTRCTFEDLSLPSYRRDKTDKRFVTYLHI